MVLLFRHEHIKLKVLKLWQNQLGFFLFCIVLLNLKTKTIIRNLLKEIPCVNISVDRPADGPPAGAPINIEVSGDDYEHLLETADNIRQFINKTTILGIEDLKLDHATGAQVGLVELAVLPAIESKLVETLKSNGWRLAG